MIKYALYIQRFISELTNTELTSKVLLFSLQSTKTLLIVAT